MDAPPDVDAEAAGDGGAPLRPRGPDRRQRQTPMLSRYSFVSGRRTSGRRAGETENIYVDVYSPRLVLLLLFFFAFLPQFVDPTKGEPRSQMLFLGLLFQVTALPTNLVVAFAGGSLANLLARSPLWAKLQSWVSSAVLIGLGLKLALSERR